MRRPARALATPELVRPFVIRAVERAQSLPEERYPEELLGDAPALRAEYLERFAAARAALAAELQASGIRHTTHVIDEALDAPLRRLFGRDDGVSIVPTLVGSAIGSADLWVNRRNPTIWTASQAFIAVTNDVIECHLHGEDRVRRNGRGGDFVAGVYPLLFDDTCMFLAVDFDGESWSSDAPARSTPRNRYAPEVGLSRQPSMFIRVDLPEPLAPIRATNSPRWISSETPRTACTGTSPDS